MALGAIVDSGRLLTAKLLLGQPIGGITHCAIGDGDDTFIDPLYPPAPVVSQTTLRHERARKKLYKSSFLEEHTEGAIVVSGKHYRETDQETRVIGIFFRFEENEANGITIKEYGFFGGNVAYASTVESDYAENGIFDATNNPAGEVITPGYLYEVKNIPDFHKTSDTRLELIGVIKI